jgi:hypothetical protein
MYINLYIIIKVPMVNTESFIVESICNHLCDEICLKKLERRNANSSLGNLSPKYSRHSFVILIPEVLNNFIKKRLNAKSND